MVEMVVLIAVFSIASAMVLTTLLNFSASAARSEQYSQRESNVEKLFGFATANLTKADRLQIGRKNLGYNAVGFSGTRLSGKGAPATGLGVNGDYYTDTISGFLWGPKEAGAWATRTNWAVNPSFETDLASWTNFAGGSVVRTRTAAAEAGSIAGGWVQKIVTDGAAANQGALYGPTTVLPSRSYTASLYVKATAGRALVLSLLEYTGSDVLLGQTQTNFTTTGNWQRISVSRGFGSTGSRARMSISSQSTLAYTAYVDSALLEQSSSLRKYFDGSGYMNGSDVWIADPGDQVAWLGTAQASTSVSGNILDLTGPKIPVDPASLAGDQIIFRTANNRCNRLVYFGTDAPVSAQNKIRIASASSCAALAPLGATAGPAQGGAAPTDNVLTAIRDNSSDNPTQLTVGGQAISIVTLASGVYNRPVEAGAVKPVFSFYGTARLGNSAAPPIPVDTEASSASVNGTYSGGIGGDDIAFIQINAYVTGGVGLRPGGGVANAVPRSEFSQVYSLNDFCT